jgi:type VI protein secretion system component VasF
MGASNSSETAQYQITPPIELLAMLESNAKLSSYMFIWYLIAGLLLALSIVEFYIWYSEVLWHKSEPKRDPRNSLY